MDKNSEEHKQHDTDASSESNQIDIEKRRRDKIESFIRDLASRIPMRRPTGSQKLDKQSFIKISAQHLQFIRSLVYAHVEGKYKHPFLSSKDVLDVIKQGTDGFVFVVSCDHGKILHMSKSTSKYLGYSLKDMLGKYIFDYVHPNDITNIKGQLLCPESWLSNSNSEEAAPNSFSGASRSFLCRIKCQLQLNDTNESDMTTITESTQSADSQYKVIRCNGFIKSWARVNRYKIVSGNKLDVDVYDDDNDVMYSTSTSTILCLVAVGKVVDNSIFPSNLSDATEPLQFSFNISAEGKILNVNENITHIVGFLPEELLGTSMYSYFHPDDIPRLIDVHKATLQIRNIEDTIWPYKFRTKDGTYIHLRSEWKIFRNPWINKIDFIIMKNYVIRSSQVNDDLFNENLDKGLCLQPDIDLIEAHLKVCESGKCLANATNYPKKEVFEVESTPTSAQYDLTAETSHESCLQSIRSTMAENNDPCTSSSCNYSAPAYSVDQDNMDLNNLASTSGGNPDGSILQNVMAPLMDSQWTSHQQNNDGNMAMLMNMLEADAGLGGQIDTSGFPWPLP